MCKGTPYYKFVKEFPELSNLAESIFKKRFNEELQDESTKREILRHTISLKEAGPLRIILFGSRARGNFDKDSNLDVLIVIKEKLTCKEKISETIRERFAKFLIPCDVMVKY